jgi:integrase/recombinase XerC
MDVFQDFENFLREQDHSKLMIIGYLNDLQQFSRWFEQTNGETFTLQGVTPTDVREYRQHLLVVNRRKTKKLRKSEIGG